jgi:hypothetical protein
MRDLGQNGSKSEPKRLTKPARAKTKATAERVVGQ